MSLPLSGCALPFIDNNPSHPPYLGSVIFFLFYCYFSFIWCQNNGIGISELSSEKLGRSESSYRFDSPKVCPDHLFLMAPAIYQIPESTCSATSPLLCVLTMPRLLYATGVSDSKNLLHPPNAPAWALVSLGSGLLHPSGSLC